MKSPIVALLFVATLAVAASADELDNILDEIDEGKGAAKVQQNPCDTKVCGWGKECVVEKHGEAVCECVAKCPAPAYEDPADRVCATNNQTFSSLCDLYRQRCLCKKRGASALGCADPTNAKIHVEYLGECKQLDECTEPLMAQFPERMADWLFQVMKELKKRRELHNLEWEELVTQAEQDDEKRHVYPVIWKFCDLDIKPHDKHVTHHELIPITAPVIPMESCIKPFLERCDADQSGTISIHEWGTCLGLKEGEIQERC